MINAIISVVMEELKEDNDIKVEHSTRIYSKRKVSFSESNVGHVRREWPNKRKNKANNKPIP